MIKSSFLFLLFKLLTQKKSRGSYSYNSRAENTVRREILQAMQSKPTRPDVFHPGVRHSATAEILTQQTAEYMGHMLCTSFEFTK